MLNDRDCAALLEWTCPHLGLEAVGFRRVRKQVCKRIARRMAELGLDTSDQYRAKLSADAAEWAKLEAACRVTISRFFRDRNVFDALRSRWLPEAACAAAAQGRALRCWSAGCCSGEEPYTLALILMLELAPGTPGLRYEVLATDLDPEVLERARRALYPWSAVAQVPREWRDIAFERRGKNWLLRPAYAENVRFFEQDLRVAQPQGPFAVILCRNLVYTYFDTSWRKELTRVFADRLAPGGLLVLGKGEQLPEQIPELLQTDPSLPIFRKWP